MTAAGATDAETRETAFSGGPLPDHALEAYLQKVRSAAYRITDGDVRNLRDRGVSEDAIFELTVAAAAGAAARLLAARLAVIRHAR